MFHPMPFKLIFLQIKVLVYSTRIVEFAIPYGAVEQDELIELAGFLKHSQAYKVSHECQSKIFHRFCLSK